MTVRYEVEDVFRLTGRGPTTVGVLTEGSVDRGMSLLVQTTGERVQVLSFDVHTQRVERGLQVVLQLTPEDARRVAPGTVLISPPA